jgi:hypothetical protein
MAAARCVPQVEALAASERPVKSKAILSSGNINAKIFHFANARSQWPASTADRWGIIPRAMNVPYEFRCHFA